MFSAVAATSKRSVAAGDVTVTGAPRRNRLVAAAAEPLQRLKDHAGATSVDLVLRLSHCLRARLIMEVIVKSLAERPAGATVA